MESVFVASEYFPLSVGNWWDYKNDSTGVIHRLTVTETKVINSTTTFACSFWDGEKEYYTSDSNGIKLHGLYLISEEFTGDIFFDSPIIYMQNYVQIGTTQTSQTSYSVTLHIQNDGDVTVHIDITFTIKILGFEDVVTENLILKNCIKVSIQIEQYVRETGQTSVSDIIYYWFYKNVGVVKNTDSSESGTLIKSYINGVNQSF